MNKRRQLFLMVLAAVILLSAACAPGNQRFTDTPAGFWAGLWHGFICLFTFLIGLFNDSVHIYQSGNSGGWYDFGYILGLSIFFGGSCKSHKVTKRTKSPEEQEWGEIGTKIEEKIRTGIKNWLDETEGEEKDWKEIAKKIEEKIKRELRNWTEKQ